MEDDYSLPGEYDKEGRRIGHALVHYTSGMRDAASYVYEVAARTEDPAAARELNRVAIELRARVRRLLG